MNVVGFGGFFFGVRILSVVNTLRRGIEKMSEQLERLEEQRSELIGQLAELGDFRAGSVTSFYSSMWEARVLVALEKMTRVTAPR